MKKTITTISFLFLAVFLFANRDSTGIGLSYEKWAYDPYFSKVNTINVGFGRRLIFPGATVTLGADSILVSGYLTATTGNGLYWAKNGNSFGAESDFGSNDAFGINLETNGTRRLRVFSGGGIYSGTVTDFDLSASDTARFMSTGAGKLTILGNASSNTFLNGSNGSILFQGTASHSAGSTSNFTSVGRMTFQTGNASIIFNTNSTYYGQLDSLGHWRFGPATITGTAAWHTFSSSSSTNGIKINGSSNAYVLLSDSQSESSWDGGLHWDGTTLKLFTPVAAAAINTAGTDRLKFGATGRIFGGTVTDFVVPASDTISLLATNVAEIGLANQKIHINSGFTRLWNGSNIMYQVNHSTNAHAFNIADNATSAFTVRTLHGALPFIDVKTTSGANQLTLGSDTTGARLFFPGYGKGVKEAADLSKTFSGYIPGFATDSATVLDVKLFEQFEVDTVNTTETISTFSAREVTIILDGTDGNVTCVFPVASAALSGVKLEVARIDVSINTVLLDPTGANNFYVASATQNDYTMVAGTSAVFRCVSIGGTYYWLRVAS